MCSAWSGFSHKEGTRTRAALHNLHGPCHRGVTAHTPSLNPQACLWVGHSAYASVGDTPCLALTVQGMGCACSRDVVGGNPGPCLTAPVPYHPSNTSMHPRGHCLSVPLWRGGGGTIFCPRCGSGCQSQSPINHAHARVNPPKPPSIGTPCRSKCPPPHDANSMVIPIAAIVCMCGCLFNKCVLCGGGAR